MCKYCGNKKHEVKKYAGWTPELALEEHEEYYVLKVVNWFDGNGKKPQIGFYIGSEGYVFSLEEATKIQKVTAEFEESIQERLNLKVDKVEGKNLVEDSLIDKLEEDYTKAQIDEKVIQVNSNLIPITGTVLPRGSSIPSYITTKGKATLRGSADDDVIYTNTGTTPSTITVTQGYERDAFYDKATDSWTAGLEQELPMVPLENIDGSSITKSVTQNLVTINKIDRLKNDVKTSSLLDNKIRGNIDTTTKKWTNTDKDFWHVQIAVKPGDDVIVNLDLTVNSLVLVGFLSQQSNPTESEDANVIGSITSISYSSRFTAPANAKILYMYLGQESTGYSRRPYNVYINGVNITKNLEDREIVSNKTSDDPRLKSRLFKISDIVRKGNLFAPGTVGDTRAWSWRNLISANDNHIVIPVYKGDVIGLAPKIKTTGAVYALLKYDNRDLVERGYAAFVNDAIGRVTINDYTEITISEDCYMYFYVGNDIIVGHNIFPDIYINGVNVVVQDYALENIETHDFQEVDYYYFNAQQNINKRINYYHILLPVNSGDQILIQGGSSYAFITDDVTLVNGATPEYSEEHETTYDVTPSVVEAPFDCNYIYIYLGAKVDDDYDRKPSKVFVNGVDIDIYNNYSVRIGSIYLNKWNNLINKVMYATAKLPIIRKPYINIEVYAVVTNDVDTINFFNKDGIKVGYIKPLVANNPLRFNFNYLDFTTNTGKITFLSSYTANDIEFIQAFNFTYLLSKSFFRTNYKLLDVQEYIQNKIVQQTDAINSNNAYKRLERLVFEDHFDTLSSIWQPAPNVISESYNTVWINDNSILYVEDSLLHVGCKKATGYERDFIGTFIKTTNFKEFPEGRIEAKIRMDTSDGYAGGFWCIGTYPNWSKCWELDIFETFGSNSFKGFTNVHYSKDDTHMQTGTNEMVGLDVSKWHVYAVEWNQTKISFYVDEKLQNEILVASLGSEYSISNMDLRFNLKATYDVDTPDMQDSAMMYVDYVRVYTTESNGGKYELKDMAVPNSLSLAVDERYYIKPTFTPTNATEVAFKVVSSNTSIVRVSEDWKIKDKGLVGVSAGTATVTVSRPDGSMEKTITVTVS